jgi:hypothetical protein
MKHNAAETGQALGIVDTWLALINARMSMPHGRSSHNDVNCIVSSSILCLHRDVAAENLESILVCATLSKLSARRWGQSGLA